MITITRQQLMDDPQNASHIAKFGAPSSDTVNRINRIARAIEATRCDSAPQPGDTLQLTTRHGIYYGHAFFETYHPDEQRLTYCQSAYTPWADYEDDQLTFHCSGGGWGHLTKDEFAHLTYVGKQPRAFCIWASPWPAEDGAITFSVPVNVWQYSEPNPVYLGYSTKNYDRYTLSVHEKPSGMGCTYHVSKFGGVSSTAFACKDEYLAWLKALHGVEFDCPGWPSNKTIFTYRKAQHLIPQKEWDELPYPMSTLYINASYVDTKVLVDHSATTIHEYRCANSGRR